MVMNLPIHAAHERGARRGVERQVSRRARGLPPSGAAAGQGMDGRGRRIDMNERLTDDQVLHLVTHPGAASQGEVRAAGIELQELRKQIANQAAIIRAQQERLDARTS